MKNRAFLIALAIFTLSLLDVSGCQQAPNVVQVAPIVGAWYTRVPGAPFEYQMYLFNADGTMQESKSRRRRRSHER